MSERLMKDVTSEFERMRCELLLLRVELGLSPIHDLMTAVRTLHERGREEFEKMRGPAAENSADWFPHR